MALIRTGAFRYNKIWVVESLPKDEPQTGSTLYRDLLRRRTGQMPAVSCELVQVPTKRNLCRFLKRVVDYVQKKTQLPFLHFEMHGNPKGLELASGEVMPWSELANYFRNINIATRNNLMVSLATCYGGFMFGEISPVIEAPFCGVIGTFSRVPQREVEEGFYEFFESLLSRDGLDNAVVALNSANPDNPKFQFISAEGVFESVRRDIRKSYSDAEFMRAKIFELTARALKNRNLRNTRSIWDIEYSIERFLADEREPAITEMKNVFLMKNLTPLHFREAG
ncbi:hypothetical protein [Hymenobacter sp. YC55]|uniref:hypothetical protein n=1 Tax=Hymenobacter sp. YC55 TaxID=3034019 RepID=UPI0023F644A4|nr:hypothetical protein [Hymenobacter sp. YC55]MDF7815313.1 hypothetical protein [Hymenobacter sp. YC55]